ncbi:hypothetical protein HPB50_000700 [Hyalomma asiaticum]|uniref:Uncharacterized protein n=1 Tax=Hyalomma asiaticum TaxID=266040 RepID=A0ACB7SLI0_HYAAI|nr:hypothetical protein HPB50_000700 [Hyalomma asiaticum]
MEVQKPHTGSGYLLVSVWAAQAGTQSRYPFRNTAPPIEKDGDYETAAIGWSDSRALHVENRRTAPLARRKILSLVDSVSFFAFPKDPLLKKRWLVAIKRDEGKLFAVAKHTKVCSTHFASDDYLPNVVGGRRYLRVDAVPSVFAFGKPQRPARRKPRDRQQGVSRAQRLSAIGQAGSSELALGTALSLGGDVAVSRDCATADEVLDATLCSDSASAPTGLSRAPGSVWTHMCSHSGQSGGAAV